MEKTNEEVIESQAVIYDANAKQRYEFVAIEDGEKFDTAHKLKPLSDERYLAFVNSVKGTDTSEIAQKVKEAAAELWVDLIIDVENFEPEENQSLAEAIDLDEKVEVINNFLAVAIVEPDKTTDGKRRPSRKETQLVKTEMFFNGLPVEQSHTLRTKSDEWQRKFDRIQKNRFKPEQTKGLSRKPKMEYVPQDEEISKLYDEMLVSNNGFENDITPLRVKTTVIYRIFESRFEEKK